MVDAPAARLSSRENTLCAHERELLGMLLLAHFFFHLCWFFWSQSEDCNPMRPLLFQDKEKEKHKVDSHHQSLLVRFGQNVFHRNKKGIQQWLPSTKRKPISLQSFLMFPVAYVFVCSTYFHLSPNVLINLRIHKNHQASLLKVIPFSSFPQRF